MCVQQPVAAVLKIVTCARSGRGCSKNSQLHRAQMADSKAGQDGGKEASAKMDVSEVPTAKDHGFGDIVTLNVGGKR